MRKNPFPQLMIITKMILRFQRAKVSTSTPMTPELFLEWKKKKMAARDAGLAAEMAERAKNDRMRY